MRHKQKEKVPISRTDAKRLLQNTVQRGDWVEAHIHTNDTHTRRQNDIKKTLTDLSNCKRGLARRH